MYSSSPERGPVEDDEPLRAHDSAAVLSDRACTVRSRTSMAVARTSKWTARPASSRSELVTLPVGLSKETTALVTVGGKGARQHRGGLPGKNQAPPMPAADASTVPKT